GVESVGGVSAVRRRGATDVDHRAAVVRALGWKCGGSGLFQAGHTDVLLIEAVGSSRLGPFTVAPRVFHPLRALLALRSGAQARWGPPWTNRCLRRLSAALRHRGEPALAGPSSDLSRQRSGNPSLRSLFAAELTQGSGGRQQDPQGTPETLHRRHHF